MPYEKVGNNEPVCIADEVPYEIPDSWEWVRLKELCSIINGFTPLRTNMEYWENPTIPWFTVDDIRAQGRRIKSTIQSINEKALAKNTSRILPSGTVLLCCTASVGEFAITEIPLTTNQQFNGLVIKGYWKKYFWNEFLFKISETFKDRLLSLAGKTTFNFISVKKLENLIIPLPPTEEQRRIVNKINELINSIEIYGRLENEVGKLQIEFPDKLRKSILQEAIQGKLVPQDPNDEPASVLLERIRAEKQRLIKEGKISKDKHESIIFRRDNSYYEKRGSEEICIDDEIPFEIPTNWSWVRASSLGTMFRGRGIKRTETASQGCPCIRYGEIYTTYEIYFKDAVSFIPESLSKYCIHFSTGDIVFTLTGENKVDIAKAVAFLGTGQIAAGSDLAVWTSHGMNPLYLVYYMASPYCIDCKRQTATGDIIVHISTTKVGNFLIPVPPFEEQSRIVSNIKRLLNIIETL